MGLDTEIDWETYMIQVKVFINGEHDYSKLTGPTGPLVWVRLSVFLKLPERRVIDIQPVTFIFTNGSTAWPTLGRAFCWRNVSMVLFTYWRWSPPFRSTVQQEVCPTGCFYSSHLASGYTRYSSSDCSMTAGPLLQLSWLYYYFSTNIPMRVFWRLGQPTFNFSSIPVFTFL